MLRLAKATYKRLFSKNNELINFILLSSESLKHEYLKYNILNIVTVNSKSSIQIYKQTKG